MDADNLVLVVGAYADAGAAAEDFKTLKAGQDAGEYQVVGAVVMNRDASGKVDVDEHGDGRTAGGAVLGGTAGLVVGLFAPPLLAATAIGAGIGAGIGALQQAARGEEARRRRRGVPAAGILGGRGGRRRRVRRQGRGRARQVGQADQQGDRLGRLRRAAEGDLEVLRARCRAQSPRSSPGRGAGTPPAPPRPEKGQTMKSIRKRPHRRRSIAGVPRGGLWLERRRLDDDDDERLRHRDLGERRLLVDHDLAGRDHVGRRLRQERSDEERTANGRRRREVGDADSRLRPEGARQARHPGRATGEGLARQALDEPAAGRRHDRERRQRSLRRERRAHCRLDGDGNARDDANAGQDDVHGPPGARRERRAEDRVRELERLQLPDR